MDTVKNFYEDAFFSRGSNATFISLIPKSNHVVKILDFKPLASWEMSINYIQNFSLQTKRGIVGSKISKS